MACESGRSCARQVAMPIGLYLLMGLFEPKQKDSNTWVH
jgi:hypothetical protein